MPKRRSSTMPPARASRRVSSLPEKSPTPPETTDIPDGRRVRGDRTRTRILEAALRAASTCGLNGLTVGQLADEAGISKGHLALLFGNREQLQLATLDAAVARFRERVLSQVAEESSPMKRLERYCLGWFDYVQERVLPGGCLITAASSEYRVMEGEVRSRLIRFRQTQRDELKGMIRAAAEECGTTGKVNVDDITFSVLAFRAAANVASLMEDVAAVDHARRSTLRLLHGVRGAGAEVGQKKPRL